MTRPFAWANRLCLAVAVCLVWVLVVAGPQDFALANHNGCSGTCALDSDNISCKNPEKQCDTANTACECHQSNTGCPCQ